MHSQDDLGEYTRKFTKFAAILIANQKLSEMERNIMFLAGFSTPLQDCICHRLAIVKPDVHPDDPYLMDDVIAAAKFLLTGSTFRSTIPPIANAAQPNVHHPTPYRPFQESAQPTIPVLSFNLPPALKTEANIAARTALLLLCRLHNQGFLAVTILFPHRSILLFIHTCCLLTWRGRRHYMNTSYLFIRTSSSFCFFDLSMDLANS